MYERGCQPRPLPAGCQESKQGAIVGALVLCNELRRWRCWGKVDHDWIYDMTDGFDGIGPVLIDDFNVTETGNRAIAERIHTVLSLDGG